MILKNFFLFIFENKSLYLIMGRKIKFTLEQETKIIELYKTMFPAEIGKLFSVSRQTIERLLKKKNIADPRTLNSEQERQVIELYATTSTKNVSKRFGVSSKVILLILKKNNIERLSKSRANLSYLSLDIDYFKTIDTEEKAYWFGWICADGYITKNERMVVIAVKDEEVVVKFKKAVGSGHAIVKQERKDERSGKTHISYSISIGNAVFVKNLVNSGVSHDKTNILEFPKIEERLYSYFLAGLFDGDGGLTACNHIKSGLRADLISTREIIDVVQDIMFKKFGTVKSTIRKVTENKSNVLRFYIYKDALKFLGYIYDEKFAEMYLQRKYKKYTNVMQKQVEHA